jgi:protein-disulfide isomerase
MRISQAVLAVMLGLLITTAGCSRDIGGVARPDPRKPGVVLSQDGYGIVAGFDNAPAKVDLFTEPQCSHCAQLQADFGDAIARYINLGQLSVTYRPMTFLDKSPNRYSARVSNALFLAANPSTSAVKFQAFVQDLWSHQQPGGKGPSDADMAQMARDSVLPSEVVDHIAQGRSALNVDEMANANFGYLYDADPLDTGTPTVYDLKKDKLVDIYDNDWLAKLIASA